YLSALQQSDFSAVTRYKSTPTAFIYDEGRNTYTPSNFGGRYTNEFIDLRQAIAQSDNIYAVNTIMKIGADQVIAMARKLGIYSEMKPLPSLALGTFPVSPYEMASAFSVIANQGVRVSPTAILRIEDADGKILFEASPQREKVMEPAAAYVLTTLMESVFDQGGTASRVAQILKRPVAGKTGTTNTDSWMVGFTPELSTAVWVGYDRDRKISSMESRKAAPIFAEFTERTLAAIPPKVFPIPDDVVNLNIDPMSGKLAGADCPNTRMEAFVVGSEPVEYCSEPASEGTPGGTDGDGVNAGAGSDGGGKDTSWWGDLKRWWND
ncbi:MAG TPA: penicillin-binding transpeptidase domain-containing protein, partial [Bacilli bacterium]